MPGSAVLDQATLLSAAYIGVPRYRTSKLFGSTTGASLVTLVFLLCRSRACQLGFSGLARGARRAILCLGPHPGPASPQIPVAPACTGSSANLNSVGRVRSAESSACRSQPNISLQRTEKRLRHFSSAELRR